MGLLDDAIREHLDLKRRSGGDPTEIEKAEREALGPVRRGPVSADEPAAAEVAGPAAPPPAFDEPGHLDETFGESEYDEPAVRTEVPQATPPSTGGRGFFRRRSAPAPEPEPVSEPEPVAEPPQSSSPPSLQIPGRRTADELDPWDEDELDGPPSEEYVIDPTPEASEAAAPRPAPPAPVAPPGANDPPTPPSQVPPGDDLLGQTVEYDVERAFQESGEADEDVLEETPEFLQDTPDHDRLWFEQRPPKDFDFDD